MAYEIQKKQGASMSFDIDDHESIVEQEPFCETELDSIDDEDGEEDHNDEASLPETIGSAHDYAEEYKAFQSIDRKSEDKFVCQYHKTKNTQTLLHLLNLREQTLRYMAKKYAYLDNEDDMYAEFKGVWLKCVSRYDGRVHMRQARTKSGGFVVDENGAPKMIARKTPFNTYLYTSMKNKVGNILKHRHSKRLLDANGKPAVETMCSLDYNYGAENDMTLKDVLADEKSIKASSKAEMSDLIKYLGADDPDVARTVDTFINNPRFKSLPAACNFKVSSLSINKWDHKVLSLGESKHGFEPKTENVQKAMTYLKQMIDSAKTQTHDYEVVSFVLHPNRVDVVLHIDDPVVLRKVKEAVARCRIKMEAS